MEKMPQKLQISTMKKIWELLYTVSYEFLGDTCFALYSYENENIAIVINFHWLMTICVLQLSWTAGSCKLLRSDLNNFIHMIFNMKYEIWRPSLAKPTGEFQAGFCNLFLQGAVFSCTCPSEFNIA